MQPLEVSVLAMNDIAVQAGHAWFDRFKDAFQHADETVLRSLFLPSASWRDLLAFGWKFRTCKSAEGIARELSAVCDTIYAAHIPANSAPIPFQEGATVAVFFSLSLDRGEAACLASLARQPDGTWLAASLVTQLDALHDVPWRLNDARPVGRIHKEVVNRRAWRDTRLLEQEFLDAEPTVVVVGAGHCGLLIAARLHALGISTLVIEKLPGVGDVWRNRYSALALHDPLQIDHLPYLPFPETWPQFTSKDKFADFLEFYAKALDLNVWTASTIKTAEKRGEGWQLEVERADGSSRTIAPRHLVIAAGQNGFPRMPDIPGAENYRGDVVHSGKFDQAEAWRGRNAIVVGTGNSGHDIAQDLYEHGAKVTMIQRSPTYVVRAETFHTIWWAAFLDKRVRIEQADLLSAQLNLEQALAVQEPLVRMAAKRDAEIRKGLEDAGFAVSLGIENKGTVGNAYLGHSHNFYHDIGCSQLIIDRKIAVRSGVAIERFENSGVVLSDGTNLPADLVVFATGYGDIVEVAQSIVGDMALACRPVFRLGEDSEHTNVWQRTVVDGLWIMTGPIQAARFYSRLLALHIAAIEIGLQPYSLSTHQRARPVGEHV